MIHDVATPEFEFLEGPKARRGAFFGLIGWRAGATGIDIAGDEAFVFGDKVFLALFASVAVDPGIVFLTLISLARMPERESIAALAHGMGEPAAPRLSGTRED